MKMKSNITNIVQFIEIVIAINNKYLIRKTQWKIGNSTSSRGLYYSR